MPRPVKGSLLGLAVGISLSSPAVKGDIEDKEHHFQRISSPHGHPNQMFCGKDGTASD
jgi:hypothetical protein